MGYLGVGKLKGQGTPPWTLGFYSPHRFLFFPLGWENCANRYLFKKKERKGISLLMALEGVFLMGCFQKKTSNFGKKNEKNRGLKPSRDLRARGSQNIFT